MLIFKRNLVSEYLKYYYQSLNSKPDPMKNLLPIVIAALVISISLLSCKKDRDAERENLFTLFDNTYITDHGYIYLGGVFENQSAQYVYLCSPEIDIVNMQIEGYGDVIYLMLLSDDPANLISGDYSNADDTFSAGVALAYDSDLMDGMLYYMDPDGISTARVDVNATTYEIEYSITLESGKIVEGYYKGALEKVSLKSKTSGPLFLK